MAAAPEADSSTTPQNQTKVQQYIHDKAIKLKLTIIKYNKFKLMQTHHNKLKSIINNIKTYQTLKLNLQKATHAHIRLGKHIGS